VFLRLLSLYLIILSLYLIILSLYLIILSLLLILIILEHMPFIININLLSLDSFIIEVNI
jgi:hypothetical protein